MIDCPKCGSRNEEYDKFCSKCGTPLENEKQRNAFEGIMSFGKKRNVSQYAFLMKLSIFSIPISLFILVILVYNLLLLQTPLFENIFLFSDAKTKVLLSFAIIFIILGAGILSQVVYLKKTTDAGYSQIRMSTTFPFLMSFIPIAGVFVAGIFIFFHFKFRMLTGYMTTHGSKHIAIATGNYEMTESVETGKASIVTGWLLVIVVLLQVVLFADYFTGNIIAERLEISTTDSYLKWDGVGNLRGDLGRYIISERTIDESRIDLRGVSILVIEDCKITNSALDVRNDAEIIVKNTSFIDSSIVFRNQTRGIMKDLYFENIKFTSNNNSLIDFKNIKMKFVYVDFNKGTEANFNNLDTVLSTFYIGDTAKVSIDVFISSDDVSNIPVEVVKLFENRGVFHIDGDGSVEINQLKIASEDRYAFDLRDNSKLKIHNVEILTRGIWHAGELRDSSVFEASNGVIKSEGEMYNTIKAWGNSMVLLENVKVDLKSGNPEDEVLEGVDNAIFVLKNSSFGLAELDDYTVLAYYGEIGGEAIVEKIRIDESIRRMSKRKKEVLNIVDVDPDRARVVKVEPRTLSLLEAAKKYRIKNSEE